MTIVSKRRMGFTSASVYRRREPHAFTYLSERATFWIAVISVFAFVTGNMVGQHGWRVFWKSVLGEGIESTIAFTGTVPPVRLVPDYERWARLGGDARRHSFRQVPTDLLVPLPRYVRHGSDVESDQSLRRFYFVEHLGTYATGRGEGSHPGTDISLPEGTPIVSIANGLVDRVDYDGGGFGHFVVVKHPNVPDAARPGSTRTLYSVYAHLSAAIVREGDVVRKGEEIGLSGATGNVTAPHLHFQIDSADAPWHPYWPFSFAEMREAGLSFAQAIDKGFQRQRGLDFTVDPMLFVQSHADYSAPAVAAAPAEESPAPAPRKRMTVAERRQARLSKRLAAGTLVAVAEDAPRIAIPVAVSEPASSAAAASSSAAPVHAAAPEGTDVATVEIRHDGSHAGRTWEKVTLTLLDAEGRAVTRPREDRKISLLAAFGRADFKPASVMTSDFVDGRITVEVLPLGEQTLVIQAEPFKSLSKPMRFER